MYEDGYWERDAFGNYHWVSYGSGGSVLFLVMIAALVDNVARGVYDFLSSNTTVLAIAAIETAIVYLIFRQKKILHYILNFIQVIAAILTLRIAAFDLITPENLQLEAAIGSMLNSIVSGFIYGCILMIAYSWGFFNVWFGIGDNDTKGVIKGVIYQFIGLGILIFLSRM